jgi:hypothetical protein
MSLFVFAICAFGILILITRFEPNPSQTNWYIYLTLLALAAAGVAALLPGAINFEVPGSLKTGGALAVFALIFWLGTGKAVPGTPKLAMNSFLIFEGSSAPTPFDSDVYVFLNSKVAKVDLAFSQTPLYTLQDEERSSTIQIKRAKEGGFRIDFTNLLPGDRIYVVVHAKNGDWRSDDLIIPESNFNMRLVSPRARL